MNWILYTTIGSSIIVGLVVLLVAWILFHVFAEDPDRLIPIGFILAIAIVITSIWWLVEGRQKAIQRQRIQLEKYEQTKTN